MLDNQSAPIPPRWPQDNIWRAREVLKSFLPSNVNTQSESLLLRTFSVAVQTISRNRLFRAGEVISSPVEAVMRQSFAESIGASFAAPVTILWNEFKENFVSAIQCIPQCHGAATSY